MPMCSWSISTRFRLLCRQIRSNFTIPLKTRKRRPKRDERTIAIDDAGFVTEGGSTNAWIVDSDGTLVTRPAENAILNGITRLRLLALARENGIAVEERAFTVEEAQSAREAFLTSTTSFVMPVVQVDEAPIGNGRPGSITMSLRELYENYAFGRSNGAGVAA